MKQRLDEADARIDGMLCALMLCDMAARSAEARIEKVAVSAEHRAASAENDPSAVKKRIEQVDKILTS